MPTGTMIREHRVRAGLSQAELAKLAGLSVRALRDIEQGRVARPHPSSLRRLADALGLPEDRRDLLASADRPVAGGLRIAVLGPVTVSRRGHTAALSSPAQQVLLTLLALENDRYVSDEEIAEALWGDRPPTGWRNRVHAYISRLRQTLEPGRDRRAASLVLLSAAGGYKLDLPADQVDAARFGVLVTRARAAAEGGDAARAVHAYEEALGLWRGPIAATLSARPAEQALRRTRLSAVLDLADLLHGLSRQDRAVRWLEPVAAEEPLHERVHSRLMAAYAHTGQQDRALYLSADLRARLAAELGVDPAAETQAAYRGILRPGSEAAPRPQPPRPAQLPFATPYFAGRDEAVANLADHLCGPARPGEIPAPRIVVLHGMPGVGKTTLAVSVAQQIQRRYPDGQLYADLRGESADPVAPGVVLTGYLRALGVEPKDVPVPVAERAALLRSYLAGRRVLMVLDDAATASQVLPLLPAAPGNDVLVTSRNALPELPVTRYRLEPLDLSSSLVLLTRLVAQERVAAESAAASQIARECAGLPLALAIAAAQVQAGESLRSVARALADAEHRIDALHTGGLAMQNSLESAYRGLSAPAREALRGLASLPTRAFPGWAVRVATDLPTPAADAVLAELTGAHLVESSGGSGPHAHLRLHDLIRIFARGKATEQDVAAARAVVLQWVRLADRLNRSVTRRSLRIDSLGVPLPADLGVAVVDANGWFDTEHRLLIEALSAAARSGDVRLATALLTVLSPHFRLRHNMEDWRESVGLVRAVAEAADDPLARAYADESDVRAQIMVADHATAVTMAERGLELFRRAGDNSGAAMMLYHLQYFKRRVGDIDGALSILADLIADPGGDSSLLGAAHQALGVIHREYLGDLDAAVRHFQEALRHTVAEPSSREHYQVGFGLATTYILRGQPAEAEPLLVNGLRIARATDDRMGIASMMSRLSDIWPPDRAREGLAEALAIIQTAGQPDVEAWLYEAFARVAERTGELDECVRRLEQTLALYRTMNAGNEVRRLEGEVARVLALRPSPEHR